MRGTGFPHLRGTVHPPAPPRSHAARPGTSVVPILIAALACSPALAQPVADGPEFQVNTITVVSQALARAAVLQNGDIVIAFTDIAGDGSGAGIFARRFDSGGAALDPNGFLVNVYTTGGQGFPALAASPNGGFVIVWSSYGQDGSYGGIFGRLFDSAGEPASPEFRVNAFTTGSQAHPALSVRPDGSFVVVWDSYGQDGDMHGVFGRRISSTGSPMGGEFPVNAFTTDRQRDPVVASDGKGGFVVAWHGYLQDGSSSGIVGRAFTSAGSPRTKEFQVNQWTTSSQKSPRIAMHSSGEFVVVWHTFNADGSGYGVAARRLHGTGSPAGPEFLVNEHTTNWQRVADVEMDPSGSFVVVWNSEGQDGSEEGIFASFLDASGTPAGGEFQVNTYTTERQIYPAVGMGAGGEFVVAWQSYDQDGSADGVFAQRYVPPDACGHLDADADGMGDLCDVALISPITGEALDCGNPKAGRPWVAWSGGPFDLFRIEIGFEASFQEGSFITSGSELKRGNLWRPSTKKWKKVCRGAAPEVYVRVLGVDTDLPETDPDRESFSQTIQAVAVN